MEEGGMGRCRLRMNVESSEGVTHLWEILNIHPMGDHESRVKLARHDIIIQDLLPIEMHRRLSIPNESYTLLHQCPNGEMVRVPAVDANKPYSAHFSDEENHLVRRFRNVGLEHQELFGFVEESFRLVECCAVDTSWRNQSSPEKR